MKKALNYIFFITTVFTLGYLVFYSSEVSISNSNNNDFPKEITAEFEQNTFQHSAEGIHNAAFSLESAQNQTSSNQIARKLIYPFFYAVSIVQIELLYKNSFEDFFNKKNLLDLFFTTSVIIFPFHYFW